MIGQPDPALVAVGAAAIIVAAVFHELTHAVVAAPFARRVHIDFASMTVTAEFSANTSERVHEAVGLAPLAFGLGLGVAALFTGHVPPLELDWVLFYAAWGVYTLGGHASDYVGGLDDLEEWDPSMKPPQKTMVGCFVGANAIAFASIYAPHRWAWAFAIPATALAVGGVIMAFWDEAYRGRWPPKLGKEAQRLLRDATLGAALLLAGSLTGTKTAYVLLASVGMAWFLGSCLVSLAKIEEQTELSSYDSADW